MAKRSKHKHKKSSLTERKIEEVDRISTLPNEILTHVLSFLQTKEAVSTSVLSTKWRSLWTMVPALDFNDENQCFSKSLFIHAVGNVLSQRRTESINRLSLESNHKRLTPSMVNLLVSIAVTKGLEELNLYYFILHATLPSRLFTCKTLSILKLGGNINLNLPSSINLPLLKVLHLSLFHFFDDASIMRLLSGCPVLEELYYQEEHNSKRSNSFRICVPSLKTLHVKSKDERLWIDTPILEFLRLEETTAIDYVLGNLDNLDKAYVEIFFDHEDEDEKENIPNLFSGIHKTRFLCLSVVTTEVLAWACLEYPEFPNLVHLQLGLGTLDSYFLMELLLEKCPKLEVLDIEKVDEGSEIEWTEPTTLMVPSCLSSHLTKFIYRGYGDSEEELEFVGYILKSGKVLKTATIQIANWLKPKKMAKSKLSVLPRASKNCRIKYQSVPTGERS